MVRENTRGDGLVIVKVEGRLGNRVSGYYEGNVSKIEYVDELGSI